MSLSHIRTYLVSFIDLSYVKSNALFEFKRTDELDSRIYFVVKEDGLEKLSCVPSRVLLLDQV